MNRHALFPFVVLVLVGCDDVTDPTTRLDTPVFNSSPGASSDAIALAARGGSGFDIFTVEFDGSLTVTQLTDDPAGDFWPAWSPDASQIAFTKNADIYVVPADGSGPAVRLTNDPGFDDNPTWSPDGRRLAFLSTRADGRSHIFVLDLLDLAEPPVQLTSGRSSESGPRWSPDGTRLTFSQNIRIQVLDLASGTITEVAPSGRAPTWSPDGTEIAFQRTIQSPRQEDLFAVAADGSTERRLTNDGEFEIDPAWSPDGSEIAYWVPAREIRAVAADGSGTKRTLVGATGQLPGIKIMPRWRPQPVGPQTPAETVEATCAELQEIVDNNPGTPLADKLEDAIAYCTTALQELNKTPPDNQAAVGNIEGAVGDLEAVIKDLLLDAAQGTEIMDRLAATARQLAAGAIEDATDRGGDPVKIAEAEDALAQGDVLRDEGAFKDAVNKYKDALAKAEGA